MQTGRSEAPVRDGGPAGHGADPAGPDGLRLGHVQPHGRHHRPARDAGRAGRLARDLPGVREEGRQAQASPADGQVAYIGCRTRHTVQNMALGVVSVIKGLCNEAILRAIHLCFVIHCFIHDK